MSPVQATRVFSYESCAARSVHFAPLNKKCLNKVIFVQSTNKGKDNEDKQLNSKYRLLWATRAATNRDVYTLFAQPLFIVLSIHNLW